MQDDLSQLADRVLATFGEPLTLIRPDKPPQPVTGIIKHELQPAGTMESVMQAVTILSLSRDIEVGRGDRISSSTRQWKVDRKLNDDGYLTGWSLHAT